MTIPDMTRRTWLKSLAAYASTMGLSPTLLSAVEQALAVTPEPGTTYADAEHIVILMQENRSFDHMFGTLRGVRGFNDPRCLRRPNQQPVYLQADRDGQLYAPFHIDLKNTRATWMGGTPHNWPDQVDARNGGRHDNWIPAKTRKGHMPLTMCYHTRQDVPFYYALADAFTVCDQYFCSTLTGTTPNRIHFWTGTCRVNQDKDAQAYIYNGETDRTEKHTWMTFPERLTDAHISWKIYQNELYLDTGLDKEEFSWLANYGDNSIEYFANFRATLTPSYHPNVLKKLAQAEQDLALLNKNNTLSDKDREKQTKKLHATINFLRKESERCHPAVFDKLSPREKKLHEQAFVTNKNDPDYRKLASVTIQVDGKEKQIRLPAGDVLHQFRSDVANDVLPAVSWLVAPENFSDHPSSAWFGAWYVSEVIRILSHNPAIWKKTIFLLTYDENDGFFDHCPPFVPPRMDDPATGKCSPSIDPTLEMITRDRISPFGLGYRVPMIIASPWSRGGWVHSEVSDHTSTLQFLEQWVAKKHNVNIRETNISSWRRAMTSNLTSAFRPWNGEAVDVPAPFVERNEWAQTIYQAREKPSPEVAPLSQADVTAIVNGEKNRALPQQEPGTKPSCALPYDVAVDGSLTTDKNQLAVSLSVFNHRFGERTSGCPFQLHAATGMSAENNADLIIRDYAVAPGEPVNDLIPLIAFVDGKYDVCVRGPNGFYRELRGDKNDPALTITVATHFDNKTDSPHQLRIQVTALTTAPALTLQIRPTAYGHKAHTLTCAPGSQQQFFIPLSESFGWYDFTVTIDNYPTFMRRYAGRSENGQPQRTDSVMGGA